MTEKDTKALNANTAATNAATAKVNSQTDEQNDFIKIYAAQIAETKGDSEKLKLQKAQIENQIEDAMWDLELSQEDLQGAKDNLQPALVAFNYCNSFDCYAQVRIGVPGQAPPPKAIADLTGPGMGFDPPTVADIPNDTGKVEKLTVATMPEIPFNAGQFGCDGEPCAKGELQCVQAGSRESTKMSLSKAADGLLKHYRDYPSSDWSFKFVGNYHCATGGNPTTDYCTQSTYDSDKAGFEKKVGAVKYDNPMAKGYKFDENANPKASVLADHKNMVGYPNLKKGSYYEKGQCRAKYIRKQFIAEAKALAAADKSLAEALKKVEQTKTLCADGFEYYLPYYKVTALIGQTVCDGY